MGYLHVQIIQIMRASITEYKSVSEFSIISEIYSERFLLQFHFKKALMKKEEIENFKLYESKIKKNIKLLNFY